MDPEFYKRLQKRPDEIRDQKEAAARNAAKLISDAQTQAANLEFQKKQNRENAYARATALATELWNSVPALPSKLESLRAATHGGQVNQMVLRAEDSTNMTPYYPLKPYPWLLSENEYAILFLFPYVQRSGNILVKTGTRRIEIPYTLPSMNGAGSGGHYDKPIFSVQNGDVSDQLGISFKTQIDTPDQSQFRFAGHFIHARYKPMSSSDLKDFEISGLPLFRRTIYHASHIDYMYSTSLYFGYPDIRTNPINGYDRQPISQSLEKGFTELYDSYLKAIHQV
jgi:hypothetical protein